ncbi:hypothetical protein ACR6L2_002656 [Enterococcus hirae]
MRETELYKPVKDFLINTLGCNEVYPEIHDMDVLGIHGAITIGVEMKTRLSFKLLQQALERKIYVEYMYIAIPKVKRLEPVACDLCKENGIGIIEVRQNYKNQLEANITLKAKFNRLTTRRRQNNIYDIRNAITEWSSLNTEGAPSGETLTPYKITIQRIQEYLTTQKRIDLTATPNEKGEYPITKFVKWEKGKRIYNTEWRKHAGDRTIEEILEEVSTHYAQTKPSVVATLQSSWNKDWCISSVYGDNRKRRYFRVKDDFL